MSVNSELRSRERYKRLVKIGFAVLLVSVETLIYSYFWIHYYNPRLFLPFWRRGNWVMFLIYAVLVILFTNMYGGFRIGILRTGNLIYSQILAMVFVDLITYLIIAVSNHALMSAMPLLYSFCMDILADIVLTYAFSRLYIRLFPRRRLLLVFGDRQDYNLFDKMKSRRDRYEIESTIYYQELMGILDQEILKYDGIIVGDIPSHERNLIIKRCYDLNIRTYTLPKISDILIRSSDEFNLFDSPLLLSRNMGMPVDQEFWKRFVDIVFALLLLILTSPLFLFEAVAIKCTDGGPVFYRQTRLTKDGKEFRIMKFRTMVMNAEKMEGPQLATEDDPRILPVGRFLRRTRLDELPQVLNILKGEMSMVGPRPERPELAAKIEEQIPEFRYRLKVKAGLTGYAQIYGRYSTQPYDKLKLDLMYIRNYSVLLDLKLIFMTPKVLFMKESSAGVGDNEAQIRETFERQVERDEKERRESHGEQAGG